MECEFTRDQDESGADAVVMELVNHPKFGIPESVPIPWPSPRPNPRVVAGGPRPTALPASVPLSVLFYYEAAQSYPRYTLQSADVASHIDISVTPSQDSTLPITMVCPWGKDVFDFMRVPGPGAKKPGRLLAYFNEHGIAREYGAVIDELFALAGDKLHSYIHKRNREMPPEAGGDPYQLSTRLAYLGTYKFVLVTESIVEDDWVEPDLSQVFLAGAVPVSERGSKHARRRRGQATILLVPLVLLPCVQRCGHLHDNRAAIPHHALALCPLCVRVRVCACVRVQVYIGAPNAVDYAPGPRSFIHIRDFPSARALWEYLASFEDDSPESRARYAEFFSWKAHAMTVHMQDEAGSKVALGTGHGVASRFMPQAKLQAQMQKWAVVPQPGGGAPKTLQQLQAANAGDASVVPYEDVAEAAWRNYRRQLDRCVHYAECRICELVTLLT